NDEILMVHEAITPIRLASHSHQNKELLDSLTAESLALLPDLQQFEDVTKYDIQTIKESIAPVVRQAHFHENLAVSLNVKLLMHRRLLLKFQKQKIMQLWKSVSMAKLTAEN
ncbi:MAG: hypothetical protein IKO32_06005, partial [Lachnospiraceae bacterium]|nr:hypothetical protein [Lachnospiraceae bacterium]